MYYTLEVHCKMDESEIKVESHDPGGSHNWIIRTITQHVRKLKSNKCARKFSDRMHDLKMARIVADYHKDIIDAQKASDARQRSYELRKYLNETFSL